MSCWPTQGASGTAGSPLESCCTTTVFHLQGLSAIGQLPEAGCVTMKQTVQSMLTQVSICCLPICREEFVAGIVRDIAAKIPEQFDLPLLAKGLGVPTPTQVVLLQELARWNTVLEAMTSSLQDLQRALSGVWIGDRRADERWQRGAPEMWSL